MIGRGINTAVADGDQNEKAATASIALSKHVLGAISPNPGKNP